jgi:adenylate kinase family enzyme
MYNSQAMGKKVLIIGPSGAGKTYLTEKLQKKGFRAFDADTLYDLIGWYNGKKKKYLFPKKLERSF